MSIIRAKTQLEKTKTRLTEKLEKLKAGVDAKLAKVHARSQDGIDALQAQIDQIDGALAGMEPRKTERL